MLVTVVASAVSAAVAGTAAWFTAKAKYERFYRDLAQDDIDELRTELTKLSRDTKIKAAAPIIEVHEIIPAEVAAAAELLKQDLPEDVVEALNTYNGSMVINSRIDYTKYDGPTITTPEGTKPVEVVEDDEKIEAIVLTEEEFTSNESGFGQYDLTYYEGDDVLADAEDNPSPTARKWLGETLKRFGDKSGDPNVVYVQIPKYTSEFSVVRDFSSYASVVAGLD